MDGGAAAKSWLTRPLSVGQLGCVLAFVVVAALAVVPELVGRREFADEGPAIGHLKTIHTARMIFREGDRDGDEVFDNGSLQQLSDQTLVDGILGSGTKYGDVFRAQPQAQSSEFLRWADPERPGATGDRYFAINRHGVV